MIKELIHPSPQRILFLYKRWQPTYDEIAAKVPHVEFINGIPPNLESDDCIDPKVRNLVILDDLMSTSTKDTKITELFCEGSHHRNLSVIALNQNLYFGRDPTQRRNTQYLILFRNPVDQMPIQTLARQMYPRNSDFFLDHFNKATRKPYGHLVVDLKPHTPEHDRLTANIFDTQEVTVTRNTEYDQQCLNQNRKQQQPRVTVSNDDDEMVQEWVNQTKNNPRSTVSNDDEMYQEWVNQTKNHPRSPSTYSCLDCGTLFQSTYDLQKHIQHWCPCNEDTDCDEPPRKKPRLECFAPLMAKAQKKNL